jgi:predicted RNase H-like HicB family nuclease
MPRYEVDIFWSEEDGGFIANVPELPYCSAFGETYEEALREVRIAMDLYLSVLREQGKEAPKPRRTSRCPDSPPPSPGLFVAETMQHSWGCNTVGVQYPILSALGSISGQNCCSA